MGAEVGGKVDITRLVELPYEIRGLPHRVGDGGAVTRIDPEIAVAQFVGWKERRAAGEVENEVTTRYGAVARRSEPQRPARGRRRHGEIIDRKLEAAEMADCGADRTPRDRELPDAGWHDLAGPGEQHGDVELRGKLPADRKSTRLNSSH